MLAVAEIRLEDGPQRREDLVQDLARFIGATSRVWTTARRLRLERLLVEAGPLAVGPVLQVVADAPRDEIIDEAVSLLAMSAERSEVVANAIVDAVDPSLRRSSLTEPAVVREVLLRALVRAKCPLAAQAKVRIAFAVARTDPSPGVRDAAVHALSTIGDPRATMILIDLLERLRPAEGNAMVLESIAEALADLRAR
jgi:HEAT repeat protein